MVRSHVLFIFSILLFVSCSTDYDKTELQDPNLFHDSMQKLTDVIVHDIFSPPVASRVYLYPTIGAYEVIRLGEPQKFQSLAGQVKGLTAIPQPQSEFIDLNLAALFTFNQLGKQFIFSESKVKAYQEELDEQLKKKRIPRSVVNISKKYAKEVYEHIYKWARGDMYDQTRTFPKYTIREEPQFWKPTPPDYMDGIEPHWNKIRTLVLDSAQQFRPRPPLAFDLTKGSPFQKQLQEVYQTGNELTHEQIEIAKFWDCNPYVLHHKGHAMFATKKITPGGHWIGITKIASTQAESDFAETIHAYMRVSIALFDAFISCWDEKWNSDLVRPETLINDYIDQEWIPLLQTPPFPEYTSGHSVISRAAAVVLTDIYGDDFRFVDTSEELYGLPARSFTSFIHASDEAAISRLYGGIHYSMAIDEGVAQGQKVGEYIVKNIQTKIIDSLDQ